MTSISAGLVAVLLLGLVFVLISVGLEMGAMEKRQQSFVELSGWAKSNGKSLESTTSDSIVGTRTPTTPTTVVHHGNNSHARLVRGKRKEMVSET